MLELRNITKIYNPGTITEMTLFQGFNLKVDKGEFVSIVGSNGSGKTSMLNIICGSIGVEGEFIHARAEELAMKPGYRDGFDFAVSRAVARLNLLAELCLPYVKEGGAFLAMKAGESEEEINEAKTAIKTLGGKIEKVVEYEQEGITRCVVIIRKLSATPKGYPRAFAKIKKNPL